MSTVAPAPPRVKQADSAWIPSSLYRLTLDQYEAMVDAGIFTGKDRVHLINGYLVEKMTYQPPHAVADELCGSELARVIPPGWYIRPAKPIRIRCPGRDSKPEPDRAVVRGTIRDYTHRTPEPADVALVVEVSKSSLDDARAMAGIYGRAGIPFYWIINLVAGQVEVYSNPGPSGYGSFEVLAPPHVLEVVIEGAAVGEIPVADVLP
jgi:Uma2 family endonuclease